MSKEQFENQYWSKHAQKLETRHHLAMKLLKNPQSVLDIGCGSGLFLSQIVAPRKEGLELSKVAVKKCKRLGIKIVQFDFEKQTLPYKKDEFDLITMLDVLEHTLDPVSQLKKLSKCGKKMIVTVPNFASIPSRLSILFGRVPSINSEKKGHTFFFTYEKLHEVFKRAGLEIINEDYYCIFDNFLLGLITCHVFHLFPSLFATEFCFEVAKKGDVYVEKVEPLF